MILQCYNEENQTDDAEIKLIMLAQRAHGAENGAKNRLANGPLRVQSNDRGDDILLEAVRVFCNVTMCVNHQGYDSILLSAQLCCESRWYRG